MSRVQTPSVSARVCDVFEQGCMFCANKPPSVFNPESYPQKMHIAEMSYCSPQGTLYVRETTAEVEETPGDDYIAPPEKKQPEPEAVNLFDISSPSYFKGLKQSCSGITFIEEKEERAREAKYEAIAKIKLEQRARWNAFLKHIDRCKKLRQLSGIGPHWYQELSSSQISLLDSLPSVLKADSDEKSTIYTRRFLNELGITPSITSAHIEKAIQDCELDPLFFLARIQSEIRFIESKKPSGASEISSFQRKKIPYTASERILLSSIVHLHMPVLLFKLHLILPCPTESKTGKIKNAVAPLEPSKLPEPKKEWFKPDMSTQEFESMLNELDTLPAADSKATINKQIEDSPSIWTMASIPPLRERKSQFFNISDGGKPKEGLTPTSQERDTIKSEDTAEATRFPSFQSFYQGVEPCESYYFIMESFTQTQISFHANQPVIRQPTKMTLKECESETEKVEEEVTDLLPPGCHKVDRTEKSAVVSEYTQTDTQWLPADTGVDVLQHFGSEYSQVVIKKTSSSDRGNTKDDLPMKDEPDVEDIIANLIATLIRKPTENELKRKEKLQKCLEENDINGLYGIFGLDIPERRSSERKSSATPGKKVKSKTRNSVTKQKRSSGTRISSQKRESSFSQKPQEEDELESLVSKIREEVKKQQIHHQLRFALKVLAVAGDPIADFPDLPKHPVIRRWFEIRRGIKRKLTEKEKDKLLNKSRKAWDFLMSSVNELKSPRIANLTPEQMAKFTWDKRLWVKKQKQLIQQEFNHEVRQAMIDDSRTIYPTMYTNYYDSKLNKNLRKVFFTYLPAKEDDYFVFKPWRPEDSKCKKSENK